MSQTLCRLIVRYACRLPAFKKLSQRIQEMPEFGAWLQQGTPEQCVPQLWEEERQLSPVGSAMYQLLVIQVSLRLVPSEFANLPPCLIFWNVMPCSAPKLGLGLNKMGVTGLQDGWLDTQGSVPSVGKYIQNANWSYTSTRLPRLIMGCSASASPFRTYVTVNVNVAAANH